MNISKTYINRFIAGIIIVSGIVFLYKDTLTSIISEHSENNPFMSLLIISLAAYFLLKKRHNIIYYPTIIDSILGILLMLFGFMLLYSGKIAGILILNNISLFIMITGIILIIIGRKSFKTLAIPLIILLSLFGIFEEFFQFIIFPLQIAAASLSSALLNMIGIPTIQDGIYLIMPHITLIVQAGCSGINHLTALIIFSLVLAMSYNKTIFSTIFLTVISPIIGLFMNAVRIVLIAIWAIIFKGKMLHGPGDIFYITFVFIFGLIALIIIASKLPQSKATFKIINKTEKSETKLQSLAPAIVILLLFIFMIAKNMQHITPIKMNKSFSRFPTVIDNWKAENIPDFIEEFEIGKTDSKLIRLYTTDSRDSLELYLGYFNIQEQEKEINNYKQNIILENSSLYPIKLNDRQFINVNHSVYYKNDIPWQLFFWYIIDEKAFHSPIKTKLYTIKNGVLNNRTNGAIAVIALKTNNDKEQSLTAFASEIQHFFQTK